MGDKSVETLFHIGVLKGNFFPHLYNTASSPFSMLDFLSLEFPSFQNNIEKEDEGLALNLQVNLNRIWNRISDMLQLALNSVNCLN